MGGDVLKPIIGVSSAWSHETWRGIDKPDGFFYASSDYINAIYKTDGVPLMLSPMTMNLSKEAIIYEIFQRIDGLLLTGGGDVGINSSGTYKSELIEQQRCRYEFEALLIKEAWKRNMPVLGICRGHQMIVEILGGSITKQPIIGHARGKGNDSGYHNIMLSEHSSLTKICQIGQWNVNSYHCQAVEKMPKELDVSAICDDGIIEAVEARDKKFFIGVQFHPELLMNDDEAAVKLFRKFIERSKK